MSLIVYSNTGRPCAILSIVQHIKYADYSLVEMIYSTMLIQFYYIAKITIQIYNNIVSSF